MAEELDDLARALRQGAGRELRAEAAEDEGLTEVQRRRRLDLAGAARAAMHRGDRATVTVGNVTVSHLIVAVGDDYLTMEDGDRHIDVRLSAGVIHLGSRPAGGRSGKPDSATLRARLGEHEQRGVRVEIVTTKGWRGVGRIDLVATDHLILVDDPHEGAVYVPLDGVAMVFSPRPTRWP